MFVINNPNNDVLEKNKQFGNYKSDDETAVILTGSNFFKKQLHEI